MGRLTNQSFLLRSNKNGLIYFLADKNKTFCKRTARWGPPISKAIQSMCSCIQVVYPTGSIPSYTATQVL